LLPELTFLAFLAAFSAATLNLAAANAVLPCVAAAATTAAAAAPAPAGGGPRAAAYANQASASANSSRSTSLASSQAGGTGSRPYAAAISAGGGAGGGAGFAGPRFRSADAFSVRAFLAGDPRGAAGEEARPFMLAAGAISAQASVHELLLLACCCGGHTDPASIAPARHAPRARATRPNTHA